MLSRAKVKRIECAAIRGDLRQDCLEALLCDACRDWAAAILNPLRHRRAVILNLVLHKTHVRTQLQRLPWPACSFVKRVIVWEDAGLRNRELAINQHLT